MDGTVLGGQYLTSLSERYRTLWVEDIVPLGVKGITRLWVEDIVPFWLKISYRSK